MSFCATCTEERVDLARSDFDGVSVLLCKACRDPMSVCELSKRPRLNSRAGILKSLIGYTEKYEQRPSVAELAAHLRIPHKTLRWHLQRLREDGLIEWKHNHPIQVVPE